MMKSSSHLAPMSGSLVEQTNRATNLRVANAISIYDKIRIPYPRHVELHSKMDYVHQLGVATVGPKKGLRALGASGQGKSTCAHDYVELCRRRQLEARLDHGTSTACGDAQAESHDSRVLYVALENGTTARGLMVSILQALDDPFWSRGSESLLRARAIDIMQRKKVELLIIDEVQHLNCRGSKGFDVTDTLKNFLDRGVAPVVFLGTEEAKPMFERNLQLNARLIPPCDLKVLTTNTEDRNLLRGFCKQLDRQIVEKGLMPKLSDLSDPKTLDCLFEVSDGVIGRVVRLIQAALEIALRREAEWIEIHDISLAVERWAIPQGFVRRNPFAVPRAA